MEKEKRRIIESPLTPKESEVLWLAGNGLSNSEIAYRLGIKAQTVKNHLSSVKTKLLSNDFISEDHLLRGAPYMKGVAAFAAESAAEHGLIPPLPERAKEYIEFLKRYHFHSKQKP